MESLQPYTVVLWNRANGSAVQLASEGTDAFDAIGRLISVGDFDPAHGELRLVAVISGALHWAATIVDVANEPRKGAGANRPDARANAISTRQLEERPNALGAGRVEEFTVFGFWTSSGETFRQVERAASGIQAMRLAAARSADPKKTGAFELQIVAAYPGRRDALVTRETVPSLW